MTRGWFGEQYEGGHCQPFCPFVRDCPSCAFRGGDSSAAQQDSASETAPRCADSGVASGRIRSGNDERPATGIADRSEPLRFDSTEGRGVGPC
jgi:hypothetical protein